MKLLENVGSLTLSDKNLSVKNYRIKVNQHSFRQLYAGLYSDRIRAIIRELSTNAYDSHVAAGKSEVPFEVHLPNELEPYFYVKDFGTGLPPERINGDEEGIYITFFDSDKVHSDDYTGCLGLGSKSPFAYTDSFTVESRWNGKKYTYVSTHNEKGEPCIVDLGSVDTDECNGMKIEFAVKTENFEEFASKAATVLGWFTHKPTVIGHADFKFDEYEYLRKTDRYGVSKDSGKSYVVMGNVAYPVQAYDFGYSKLTDVERSVIDYGVHLFVDIGDVEFVPSREALAMTDKTVAGVKKFLGDAIKSIQEELEAQVQAQPTVWKARRMLHDIKHSILGKVRPITTLTYNGKEISEYIKFVGKPMMQTLPDGTEKQMRDSNGCPMYEHYGQLEVLSRKKEHYKHRGEDTLHCGTTPIYLNDLERGGMARVIKKLRENGADKAYFVTADKAWLDETGISEAAIPASTLPKIVHQKREVVAKDGTRTYVKRTTLQEFVPSRHSYLTEYWKDVEKDMREGGVYVITSYGQIIDGDKKTHPQDILRQIELALALDPNLVLYGIRPAHLNKMGRYQSRWIKLEDYLNKLILNRKDLLAKALLAHQLEKLSNNDRWSTFKDVFFAKDSLFGNFLEKVATAQEASESEEVNAFTQLNEILSVHEIKDEDKKELKSLEKEVMSTYTLFNHIDWWDNRQDGFKQSVTDYVNGVDYRLSIPLKEVV